MSGRGPRVILAVMALAFCLLAPAFVRADTFHTQQDVLDCTQIDNSALKLSIPIASLPDSFVERFEGNNGKHLGFSVAAFHGGLKFALVQPGPVQSAVTQNPEPATMILLGSGFAAAAGFIRRTRKRNQ